MTTLEALFNKSRAQIKAIDDRELPDASDSEPDVLEGKIFAKFEENESFETYTGFPRDLINHWVDIMIPFAQNARKRGPQPKSSIADALLCYLAMLRIPTDAPTLAKTLGMNEAQFTKNIERIRIILNQALKTKWPDLAPRPLDDNQRKVYEAGLLIDCITTECFRPKGRFGEVKHYFDGHNWIYGLKEEVAITSARPHVMVAVSPHSPASVSDYEKHKANYENYLPYLHKTQEERELSRDKGDNYPFWGVIGDKLYIGPAGDTPNERRITPKKGHHLEQSVKKQNKVISVERTPVEQYFGRLVQKFPLFATVYKLDHSHFDLDFENACLLINEDINISNLAIGDGEFYQKFLDARIERWKEAEKKRKAKDQKYRENKKHKLEKVKKYVDSD